jgi:hypothetical protein
LARRREKVGVGSCGNVVKSLLCIHFSLSIVAMCAAGCAVPGGRGKGADYVFRRVNKADALPLLYQIVYGPGGNAVGLFLIQEALAGPAVEQNTPERRGDVGMVKGALIRGGRRPRLSSGAGQLVAGLTGFLAIAYIRR